jgi:hypothetical protein
LPTTLIIYGAETPRPPSRSDITLNSISGRQKLDDDTRATAFFATLHTKFNLNFNGAAPDSEEVDGTHPFGFKEAGNCTDAHGFKEGGGISDPYAASDKDLDDEDSDLYDASNSDEVAAEYELLIMLRRIDGQASFESILPICS